MNDNNKKINDINNIKNKESKTLINDIVYNIGNKKFDDPANIDLLDKINKDNQTDETDKIN